ncbi:MAG: hypothetical protein R2726_23175, partial [Acidimicrobiales bacterium]
TVLDELEASFAGTLPELSDLDPLDRIKVLVRRFVRFSAQRPEFGRILSYEGAVGGDRLDWLLGQPPAAALGTFSDLLAQGVADGWVKPLPLEHVTMCLGAAAAYAFIARETMRQVYGVDVADPTVIDAHADTVIELFFHGLVVAEATAGPGPTPPTSIAGTTPPSGSPAGQPAGSPAGSPAGPPVGSPAAAAPGEARSA